VVLKTQSQINFSRFISPSDNLTNLKGVKQLALRKNKKQQEKQSSSSTDTDDN
jgi:hypothetical protein